MRLWSETRSWQEFRLIPWPSTIMKYPGDCRDDCLAMSHILLASDCEPIAISFLPRAWSMVGIMMLDPLLNSFWNLSHHAWFGYSLRRLSDDLHPEAAMRVRQPQCLLKVAPNLGIARALAELERSSLWLCASCRAGQSGTGRRSGSTPPLLIRQSV